jgi:nitrogen fixation NifU-like protein
VGLDKLNQLYRAVILDHASNPHHHYVVPDATNEKTLHNTTCGDTINLSLRLDSNGTITDIGFTGEGCTISQASASMLTDVMLGKSRDEGLAIAKIFSDLAIGKEHSAKEVKLLGDAQVLTEIMEFPARIKCATLAWWAFQRALSDEPREEN